MIDYCWLCESQEGYEPHPTAKNVMSKKERPLTDRPMVCDKHKKPPKWECPNCRFITGTKPYPYANNDNQMCPKCKTIMDVVSNKPVRIGIRVNPEDDPKFMEGL